jgi:hypothetical protein
LFILFGDGADDDDDNVGRTVVDDDDEDAAVFVSDGIAIFDWST